MFNSQGQVLVRAEITTEVSPQQLFIPIHWNATTANNSKPCSLITNTTDKLSGQPEFKHSAVSITPFMSSSSAIFLSTRTFALEGVDYWVRQKVVGGYLYRIESKLSVQQLGKWLKKYLEPNAQQQISIDSGQGVAQWLNVNNTQSVQLLSIQAHFEEDEIAMLNNAFQHSVELQQPSKLFQASLTTT